MTTQYTPILKLALPVQGELSGTWGDVVNDNITSMIEQAIAGRLVINTWSGNSHTLTTANGTTAEARAAMLTLTDSNTQLSAAGTVVCPALNKTYIVKNGAGQIITVKTASGSGIAIPNGKTMLVYCDGTNVLEGVDHVVTLSAGTLTITGLTTFASLKGADATTVTGILDEDNMASNSATKLATQQSIKAYVDAQVDTADTLAEILAIGNTTGSNDIDVDAAQKVQFRDAAIYINSSADGQLDIVADTEIQIATATVDLNGNLDVSGTALVTGTLDVDGATQLDSTLTVGVNDTGHDVKFFGASSGSYMLWDESADDLILGGAAGLTVAGDLDVDGTTNLDVVDIDGAVQADGTITVGVNDTGYDVKFFGATDGKSLLWDESADSLIVTGDIKITQAAGGTFLKFDVDGTTDEATVGMDATDLIISVDPTNARSSSDFIIKNDGTETFRIAANGTATFAGEITANGGITTDGITSSAPMTITLGGNNTQLTLESTDGDATVGPRFDLHRNSASPAASDNLGQIRFLGDDSAGGLTSYAFINSFISNPADGAESGEIVIETRVGGINRPRFTATPTETSINEEGADLDFRVESDDDTHALFVEGSSGKVGIGVAAPQANLQTLDLLKVSSADQSSGSIIFGDGSSTSYNVGIGRWNGSSNAAGSGGLGYHAQGPVNGGGHYWYLGDAAAGSKTEVMRINGSGTFIFNDVSADVDFRVESNANTHAFFVDGGTNKVGFNTASPASVTGGIHVVHNAGEGTPTVIGDEVGIFQRNAVSAQSVALSLISGTASQSSIYFGDKDDIDAGKIVWDNSSNNFRLNAMTAVKIAGNTTTGGNIQFGITGNNSAKYAALTSTQYAHDSETEGYALITGNSYTSAINQITIGGGLAEQNAATSISLTTATNATTRTGTSRLFISSVGDIICNDNSTDSDFRVESNSNANMLFIDGGANRVGIGTNSSLTRTFNIDDGANGSSMAIVGTNATAYFGAVSTGGYGTNAGVGRAASNGYHISGSIAGDFCVASEAGANFRFGTSASGAGTSTRMLIAENGEITKPSQPAFCCKPSSVQSNMATGGVTIAFGSELFDIGANFAGNAFTAPATGKYSLNFSVRLDQVPTNPNYIEVKIITSNNTFHWLFDPVAFASSPTYCNAQNSVLCDMDAGDTAYISYNQNGGTAQVDCSTESHFSGYLAC